MILFSIGILLIFLALVAALTAFAVALWKNGDRVPSLVLGAVVLGLLLIIAGVITEEAKAAPLFKPGNSYKLIEVEEMSVEALNYEAYRDPYFPEHGQNDFKHEINTRFKVRVLSAIYFENRFFMGIDNSPQVRHAGLEYTLGLEVFKWLDIVRYHMSRHVLEESRPFRFPVTDAYGVKINLIK